MILNILIYILFGIFGLFFLVYLIYAIIYNRVRKTIDKIYKYQEKYKEYAIISFYSSVKPLELLTRDNNSLKFITDYMKNYDIKYKNKLNEILIPINELSNPKNHFEFKYIKKIFKQIDESFKNLDMWINDFKTLTKDSSVYQNNASKLLVNYRILMDDIIVFLQNHILNKYDSPVFKNFLADISNNFKNANNAYTKFNNDEYINSVENLRQSIHILLLYANHLYEYDKKTDFIKYLIREIDLLFKNANNEANPINALQLSEASLIIKEANEMVKKIDNHLHLLQLNEAKILINSLLENLQPLKRKLYKENEAKDIVKCGLKNFINSANLFQEKSNQLVIAINNLNSIFSGDNDIANKIADIHAILKFVMDTINSIQSKSKKQNKDRNYNVLLNKMKSIVDAVTNLKNILDNLILLVDSKMNVYKNVIYKINDLKLKYAQLEQYNIKNKINIPDSINKIFLEWKNKIIQRYDFLSINYEEAIKNFNNFVNEADLVFISTIKVSVELATLKRINELTLMFLNKYRHEDDAIQERLEIIENLYKSGDFELSIEKAIQILKIIKQSASRFNLDIV